MITKLICMLFGHDVVLITSIDGMCARCKKLFLSKPAR